MHDPSYVKTNKDDAPQQKHKSHNGFAQQVAKRWPSINCGVFSKL
jgi:hypothetical protein